MAEATGLRNNALNYPVYGAPYGVTFPILDADGDLVTGAAGLDSEVSKNGDTFADCTNEATEIATSSGMYYLLLTATELTTDVATIIVKTSTSGAKTTPMVLYPRKLVTLRSGTVGANAADGTTIQLDSGASALDDYYNGCLVVGTLDGSVEARIISDYVGSTKVCTVSPAFVTSPDNNDTYVVYLPEGKQLYDDNTLYWNQLTTVALPLVPTTAGRTLDVSAGGEAGVDWANIGSPTTTVNLSGTSTLALEPTTAGRKLDVSAGGEAGLDWANIGSPTTAQNLSATNIDVDQIVASVSGAVGSVTGNVGGNVAGSVGSVTGNVGGNVAGSVGSVTGNVGGNVTGSVGSVAAGGIAAASFAAGTIDATAIAANAIAAAKIASGAITAAKFAASAIDASALATDAVQEIRDAIFARAFSAAYNGLTFDEIMKVLVASQAAETSGGATTTFTIRDLADGADVIVATVDANGNRSAVTITP